MMDDSSEDLPYSLANLPPGPLGDMAHSLSPFELAAIRNRRTTLRGRDAPDRHTNPATLASTPLGLVPGSGFADFLGYYPDLEGGYEPSFAENIRRGNYGAAGWQTLGLGGDLLYFVPPLGIAVKAAARAGRPIGKWAKYAEKYPEAGPPALYAKGTKKELSFSSPEEAETLIREGKAYWGKKLTPEVKEFAKDRRAVQRDMDQNGFDPYFDPSKRTDVDPKYYPTSTDVSAETMPKKQETIDRHRTMLDGNDSDKRLVAAYSKGKTDPNSANWHALKQVEDEFVKEFGPVVGREAFKERFVGPFAATTAGNNPTQNLLMSRYAMFENNAGRRLTDEAYKLPYPIGGRFARSNLRTAQKYFDDGFVDFGAKNPKRHNFMYSMLGHRDKHVIDERVSRVLDPSWRVPPYYGLASEKMDAVAKQVGARDARDFGDPVWAGEHHRHNSPAIQAVNESIERTHRLTGMPREKIVRLGLVRGEIPMYAVGGLIFGQGLNNLPGDESSPNDDSM